MKKKLLAALLTSALAATAIVGCGGASNQSSNSGSTQGGSTSTSDSVLGNGDKVKLGVEVYDTTDEQFLAMQKYFDYLASTYDNLEFVYSESLADADAELSFIDSCATQGCNGIIGYYNIAEEAAIDECISQGMYYWGTQSLYDSYADDEYYVGCYNFLSDVADANGDYLGGYYMAMGLGESGVKHVFYCSGGYGMNIPMFVDRYNGFVAGIKAAQEAGYDIQFDESTDVVDGWPDADGFAQNVATMLDGDYDGAAVSFNAAALFQPIETAGKADAIKLATIGEVSDTYSFAIESGEISTVVYDCEEVVFGNCVALLANAIQGTAVRNEDGTAPMIYTNRWVVTDADTYNKILEFHNAGNYYVTAEDMNKLMGADYTTVNDFYSKLTIDSIQ